MLATTKTNYETLELSRRNLRAQYLIFWLRENRENYGSYIYIQRALGNKKESIEVLKEALKQAETLLGKKYPLRKAQENIGHGLENMDEDARNPYFEVLRKYHEDMKWLAVYDAYQSELDCLTKALEGDNS